MRIPVVAALLPPAGLTADERMAITILGVCTKVGIRAGAYQRTTPRCPVGAAADTRAAAGIGRRCQWPGAVAADADTPALPSNFHMLIVFRAMYYYGGYESASEVYQRGEFEFKRLMERLNIDQLPTIVSGPPLA